MPTFGTVLIFCSLIKWVNYEADNISSRLLLPYGSHTVLQGLSCPCSTVLSTILANSFNPLFTWMFSYIYEVSHSDQNTALQIATVCMVNSSTLCTSSGMLKKGLWSSQEHGHHSTIFFLHSPYLCVSARNALSNKKPVDSLLHLCLPHCNRE
jgi:hypothetical protein